MPESAVNSRLRPRTRVTSFALPVTNTMPHAIRSTTPVRSAVARLLLTSCRPNLASMLVSAANTADSAAHTSQPRPPLRSVAVEGFRSSISSVPAAISTTAAPFHSVNPSVSSSAASRMVSTVEDLSTAATAATGPSCSALK